MRFKNIIKQKSGCRSRTPCDEHPSVRPRCSPPLQFRAGPLFLVQEDTAQNRRAPMLPTSLCSFTKISKYW